MKLKILNLSKGENRKGIVLPKVLTKELAEDIGWQIGDGCINISEIRKRYLFKIAGDPKEEKLFYDNIIIPTKNKIFKMSLKARPLGDGSYGVMTSSKPLVYFYHRVVGLPLAPKIHITIPSLVLNSRKDIIISCIRGIFDTDAILYFRKKRKEINHYPSIQLESISKRLIDDLMGLLKSMDINCCVVHTKRPPTAYGYVRISHRIYIEGKKKLDKWMKVIGFKNLKHFTKYKIWKRFGFCPSHTTLEDRIKILEGKLDPYKFYKDKA